MDLPLVRSLWMLDPLGVSYAAPPDQYAFRAFTTGWLGVNDITVDVPARMMPHQGGVATADVRHEHPYDLWHTLFVLAILLFPGVLFRLFFVYTSALIVIYAHRTQPRVNAYALGVLALVMFYVVATYVRTITASYGDVVMTGREYVEAGRFVPLALLFLFSERWRTFRFKNLLDATLIYIFLDGIVSYLQLRSWNLFGIVDLAGRYYNSELHFSLSLQVADRALGLSSGPGQHGGLLGTLTVVLLADVFVARQRRLLSTIALVGALMLVVASQSKTSFIATGLVLMTFAAFSLAKGDATQRRTALLGVGGVIASSSLLIGWIWQHRYLATLFTDGLARNSYVSRVNKWDNVIGSILDYPLWMPIGHGKEFFGETSGAMDNEYVYIVAVYGVLVFVAVCMLVVTIMLKLAWKEQLMRNPWDAILFFATLGGLVYAWPSAYFTDPKIMHIVGLVICVWRSRQEVPGISNSDHQ